MPTVNWDEQPTRPEIRLPMRRQKERDEELKDLVRQRRETVPHEYTRGTLAGK